MASITIRDLDPTTKKQLRIRAARRGVSMEEEARQILREAVVREGEPVVDLASAIRALFRRFGGIELPVVPRDAMREPPELR